MYIKHRGDYDRMCTTAERVLGEMFLQIAMERPGTGEWDACMTRPDSEGQGLEKLDRGFILSIR